ncbi:solute carrier family 51 subunit beta [Mugil cephalus]|uniref:solute carrier family 51 subunit beta n=1 Tax=Mugil cephalus TaxID=48193 RepID=UPI001FB802B8|nr:solute carrier family 51 subunit beta [Mugil cephalus]XP_047437468.1 solute carrier family 51 subunit beta [Mugil cephalus]
MFDVSVLLLLLLTGARAFMIQNAHNNLCLEDSADTGKLMLNECSLDSDSQQWMWTDQGRLMCVGSSRCLWAQQRETPQTRSCHGQDDVAEGLMWDYDGETLISRNKTLLLSVRGQDLVLTRHVKRSKWRLLDEGDERLRLRRGSDYSEYTDEEEEKVTEGQGGMTEEQREYLRWYYRTEDPTIWKFVLLGLSFICLLVGFLLLGIGTVANKSRKKIAKYKAAASLAKKNEGEEMQAITPLRDTTTPTLPRSDWQLQERQSSVSSSPLKAGNISVTWKDGNTSYLYTVPAEEEKQEHEQEEVSTFQEEGQ